MGLHDCRAANLAPECSLVDDAPHIERVVVAQHCLPLHAYFDPALNLIAARVRQATPDHSACVVFGLKQARHEQRFVVPHAVRFTLEADVSRVVLR